MELSSFEKKALVALIKNNSEANVLLQQLINAVVVDREYTGVGLLTELRANKSTPLLSKSNHHIEGAPKTHLSHPELKDGGGMILWLLEGKISTLECYTYGEEWPEDEDLFEICT